MRLLIVLIVLIATFNLPRTSFGLPSANLRPSQACKKTGCFDELCARATIITHNCPLKPKPGDECKKFATCGFKSGQCRWTETKAYQDCVRQSKRKRKL